MLGKINKFIVLCAVSIAFVSCCTSDSRVRFAGTATPIPLPDELLILVEAAPDKPSDGLTEQPAIEVISAKDVTDSASDAEIASTTPDRNTRKARARGIAPGSKSDWVREVGGNTLLFSFDNANIQRVEARLVSNYVQFLKKYKDMKVVVIGHTDALGTREYNLALGERRATNIKRQLEDRGIDKSRIRVVSFGEEVPVVNGDSTAANAQNRRVEVDFIVN